MKKKIRLRNLHEVSEAEVFNYAYKRGMKQGKKSENEDEWAYRGVDGSKCFAGFFISKKEYKKEFEGKSWNLLVYEKYVPDNHSDLIFKLQGIHDDYPVDEWKEELFKLGEEIGLIYSGKGKWIPEKNPN